MLLPGSGLSTLFARRGPAAGANWAQLFTAMSSPPGVAYAFGDSTQLSTSRTGGSWGVASTDPVGYALDQARGGLGALGAELVSNRGGPFAATTGWTAVQGSGGPATLSVVGEWLRVTANGATGAYAATTVAYPAGSILVTIEWRTSGGTAAARVTTFLPGIDSDLAGASGSASIVLAKTGGTNDLRVHCKDTAGWVEYRIVSVRQVPGLHAAATSDVRRPVYGSFDGGAAMAAQFNGTAHCLQTVSTLDMTSTDEVHVFAAVRALADTPQMIAEVTTTATSNNGAWYLYRPGTGYRTVSRGTATAEANSPSYPQPDSALLYRRSKIGVDILTLDRNGTQVATSPTDQASGNLGNHLLNIGARNAASPSLYFNGRIANLAIIGGPMTPEQIAVASALTGAGLTFSP